MKRTIPKLLTLVCLLVAIMGLSIVTAHAATVTGTISGGNEYRYHEDKSPVPQWGAFTSTKLKYFTRNDTGATVPAYCMEPSVRSASGDLSYSSTSWSSLSWNQRYAVTLALSYGYGGNYDFYGIHPDCAQLATQAVIWEFVCGYRGTTYPYTLYDTTCANLFHYAGDGVQEAYDILIDRIMGHGVIPSFAVKYRNQLSDANAITLTWDGSQYVGTATDTNGVLPQYYFDTDISGVSVSRRRNVLTVTATKDAAAKLNGYISSDYGYSLDVEGTESVLLEPSNGSNYQACTALTSLPDPVWAYIHFKVNVLEEKGSITVRKVDATGAPLAGAELLLETSADGKTWTEVSRITTDKTGIAKWSDLKVGVQYRVTETKAPAGYTLLTEPLFMGTLDSNDRDITITACNSAGFVLPFTGGMGFTTYFLFAALMLCMGVYFCKKILHRKGEQLNMKKNHRVLALLMAALMALGLITTAFAEPTINPSKKASLSIYKYDITTASAEGAWDAESYVSTGLHDDTVVDKLAKYAIQGVEFTYLRVADVAMNNEVVDSQRQVGVLYGFDSSERSNAVLSAIGLTAADAHKTDNGINYFTSDMLNNKLTAALAANATSVKNALEAAVKNGGVAMTETDATGHTSASDMEQGLYLVVETRVPENVTSTCNPFFVSLPMTTIDGSEWNYDLTVYPKNQTGNPDLEKTVREAKNSTGKNNGSLTDIEDGYAHTATASVGDVVDYQIISTLPTITSKASSLSEYTYVDTMSKGIRYNKNDVVIEFFKDTGCTDKITTWNENSGKFTVAYDDTANTMTIRMTDTGLSEINEAATVYTDSVKRGYSDCTMRITYAATLTADAQMGDTDNPNEVELTWRRTNSTYFDTLKDCCHVYTYGVDVLKQFSDNGGNLRNVKFKLHNDTDDVYVIAEQKDGVYYAKGFVSKKADATTFVSNSSGHIVVKGLEDDVYSLTEIATDKNYVLLKEAVKIVIKTAENGECEKCGAKLLTASATVNGEPVSMTDANAVVPLRIINNPGFDLPKTGGYGVWMYTVGGVLLLGAAAFIVVKSRKHKSEQ